jgi:hypothetical protein
MLLGHLNDGVEFLETVWSIVDGHRGVANELEPRAIYWDGVDI